MIHPSIHPAPKDQTKRKMQIQILEAAIAKQEAAIRATQLTLQQQQVKLVHRLAELRLQKMLLKNAEQEAAWLSKTNQSNP